MISSLFCSLLLAFMGHAQVSYTAQFFEQGSQQKNMLFSAQFEFSVEGDKQLSIATYKDPSGQLLFEDRSELKDQQILKVEIQQKQLGQAAKVEVRDGRIYFSKTEAGKTKTADEKKQGDFVMSGNFQLFVRQKWETLKKGETVQFRFGVWDRLETVGFELFKESETDGQVRLKMKPSSFLIAALVKPLYFDFAPDGQKLLAMNGRVPVKKKKGDRFEDLDAEALYSYAK